jgi:hypothetical protein
MDTFIDYLLYGKIANAVKMKGKIREEGRWWLLGKSRESYLLSNFSTC